MSSVTHIPCLLVKCVILPTARKYYSMEIRSYLTKIILKTYFLRNHCTEEKQIAGRSLDGTRSKLCPAAMPSMTNCSLYIKNSNTCDIEHLDLNMFEFLLWLM